MPTSTFNGGAAPKRLPDEAWPLTEQPWLCATGHRWKSHSPWWKQFRCPNCSCNYRKYSNVTATLQRPAACQIAQTSLFCVPPAQPLELPLWLGFWEDWWSPFEAQQQCTYFAKSGSWSSKKTNVLPRSECKPSPRSHGSKNGASAWQFLSKIGGYEGQQPRDLWPNERQQWKVANMVNK